MKGNKNNSQLEELIRVSMKITDVPSSDLNQRIKMNLYKQESMNKQETATRSITLCYIPMILNIAIFFLFSIMALTIISNLYISALLVAACGYFSISGIVLTFVAIKRTNIKINLAVHLKKRGVIA